MKVSVLIDANASALKAEAAASKAAIEKIGTTATVSSAGIAKLDAALEETAAASREASAAIGALTTAEGQLDAASSRTAAGVVKIESALEQTSHASREASQAIAALIGSQGQLLSTSQQLVAALTQSSQGASSFEAAARAMVASTANLDAALKKTSDAHERFIEQMTRKPPANDNPFEAPAKGADELRAKYDPLFAIGLRYKQQVEEIRAAHAAGNIETATMAAMIERVGAAADASHTALVKSQGGVVAVGGAAKLTGAQMQGLGYQVNDIATMLAMGASPFQVIASQAGQVVQVLGEGGGMRASLKAIGTQIAGLVTSINPMIGAFALAGTAAATFAFMSRKEVKPLSDVILDQEQRIKALASAYGVAATSAEQYGRASTSSLRYDAQRGARTDQGRLQYEAPKIADMLSPELIVPDLNGNILRERTLPFKELKSAYDAFQKSIDAGQPDVVGLRDELAKIASTTSDKKLRAFADSVLEASKDLPALQGGLSETARLLNGVAQAAEALKSAQGEMKGFLPPEFSRSEQVEQNYQKQLAAIRNLGGDDRDIQSRERKAAKDRAAALREINRSSLEDLIEAEAQREDITKSSTERQIAEIRRRADRLALEAKDEGGTVVANIRKAAEQQIAAVNEQAARAESQRRQGYDLDVRAITARTAAQRAGIEAERAQNAALAENLGPAEAARRGEEARTLVMAQAREQVAEATRQQTIASTRQIAQAQLEYDLVGKSSGEVARLRAEFDLLAQAKDAARAAGFDESTVTLTGAMRDQAAEIGRLTEATQRLNFERDLLFDRQQATRSPQEQRIADQLRQNGVDYDSVQGRADAAQLRLNEKLHKTNDLFWEMRDRVGETFGDLIQALASGENAFDSITKVAANFFSQFVSAGADRLTKLLTGVQSISSGGSSSGGLAGILGSVSTAVSRVAVPTARPSYTPAVPIPTARPDTSYSIPIPTARASLSANDFASASGAMMSYAGRFNSNVDSRLLKILNEASSRFDMRVEAISGLRPGDSRFHGKGVATDVQIYNASGKALDNYQDGAAFRTYERFAQTAKRVQQELFPELEGMLRWGGYFSGGKGKYGALDTMHFDLAGNRVGMGGGSWEDGLTASQRRLWANAESVGMSRQEFQRTVTRGTTEGVKQGLDEVRTPAASGPATSGPAPQMSGGQQALMGIAGLVGAFSGGYQSGSPFGGALNGAMGGFELGSSLSFLGAAGGPIGAAVGGIVGLIGGIFGKRKQKKAEEAQARREWEAMQPQHEAFRKYLSGEESGALRTDFMQIQAQFDQFNAASTKAKNGDLVDTARIFYDYVTRQLTGFREAFEGVSKDLAEGAGLNGPFAKGKASIRQLQKELLGFLDDVNIAYGSADNGLRKGPGSAQSEADWAAARAEAMATAQRSAQEAALSILNPPKELSATEENYRAALGAAQQLITTLPKLGMSAADATRRVGEELAKYVATLRGDVELGVSDRILELTDKSYITDVRKWLEQFATLQKQAELTGADTSNFGQLFSLELQAIVDGAELTGDAFQELVALFPQIGGAVKDFAQSATASTKQIQANYQSFLEGRLSELTGKRVDAENALSSAVERSTDRLRDMKEYLDGLRLDPESSTLNGEERLKEAERIFNETRAKADAGDQDAADKLLDVTEDYRSAAKDFYQTSAGYGAVYKNIESVLTGTASKIESEIDVAKRSASFLSEIAASSKSIPDLLKEYLTALQKEKDTQKLVDGNRSFGLNPTRNRSIDAALKQVGLNFSGNYGINKSGVDEFYNWRKVLPIEQLRVVEGIINQYIGMNYATGGYTGDHPVDRIVGGVHGQEFVINAPATRAIGRPALEEANRTGILPMPRSIVSMSAAAASAASSAASFGAGSADRAVLDRLDNIADVLRGGFRSSIEATDRIGSAGDLAAAASRRDAARSVTRWAA